MTHKRLFLGLLLLLSHSALPVPAVAQEMTNSIQPYSWDSGPLSNSGNASRVMSRHRVSATQGSGLRLHFTERALGSGVSLRIRSQGTRAAITLDDEALKALRYTTPYLNGRYVSVEVLVGARKSTAGVSITAVEVPLLKGRPSNNETICGTSDDRIPSDEKQIGRMVAAINKGTGCTGTLIGPRCMVSAGHCTSVLNVAQFNVPRSNDDGKPNFPGPEDQYPVERVVDSADEGEGNDWAVYRMGENVVTKLLPGDVQGFLAIEPERVKAGTLVRITGYGRAPGELNATQQTQSGPVKSVRGSEFDYEVDTEPGNSGAAVILESSNTVIGIHAIGSCGSSKGNIGTLLAARPEFRKAVRECLADEQGGRTTVQKRAGKPALKKKPRRYTPRE